MAEQKQPLHLGAYHMVGNDGFEPQRTNNFELQINFGDMSQLVSIDSKIKMPSNSSELITLSVANFTPPSVNIDAIEVNYGNSRVKFAGRATVDVSDVTFNDFVGIDVERILMAWQRQAADIKAETVGLAREYKKSAFIIEYNTNGTQARQWQLVGCWLASLKPGEYSQDDNTIRKISGTLIYDYAYPVD